MAILCPLWNKPPDMLPAIKNALNDGMFRVVTAKSVRAIEIAITVTVRDSKSLGHFDNDLGGIFECKISKVASSTPQDSITFAVARDRGSDISFASLNPVRPINYLTTGQIFYDFLFPKRVLLWRTEATCSKM